MYRVRGIVKGCLQECGSFCDRFPFVSGPHKGEILSCVLYNMLEAAEALQIVQIYILQSKSVELSISQFVLHIIIIIVFLHSIQPRSKSKSRPFGPLAVEDYYTRCGRLSSTPTQSHGYSQPHSRSMLVWAPVREPFKAES